VSRFFVVVPREPQPLPMNLEIPPANCGVHGFAFHADGRPFAKAEISVFRANPAGWIDATGPHTVTNADGEFEFAALAKGDHAVVVSGQPNEAPGVARFVASDSYPEVEVHSSLGRATLFRILGKPTDRVTPPNPQFQILDSTGLVLEDLHSHWASVSKSPEAVTLRLEDGHYTVIVERYGFRQARLEFDVPRESFDIPLALQESEAK
jgi:hypothetical protein